MSRNIAVLSWHGIQCLVMIARGDGSMGFVEAQRAWWSGYSKYSPFLPTSPSDVEPGVRNMLASPDMNVVHAAELGFSPDEAIGIVEHVASIMSMPNGSVERDIVTNAPPIYTWGGVRRLFSDLASCAPERVETIAQFARSTYDLDFQFIRTLGYPLQIENVADTMLKADWPSTDEMRWPEDAGDIAHALVKQAQLTIELIEAIMDSGEVRWITRAGDRARREIGAWHSVASLMKRTYGTGPDGKERVDPVRHWKDYDGRYDLARITGWMKGEFS